MRAPGQPAPTRSPQVEYDISVSFEWCGNPYAMTWVSALSDISVSFAGSAAQAGRMRQPDPRRKKFRAIEEHAGHADSCLLTRAAGPDYRAPRCSGRDRFCLRLRPQPGWWPGSAKHVLPDFDGQSRNVPLKLARTPLFPMTNLRMAPGVM